MRKFVLIIACLALVMGLRLVSGPAAYAFDFLKSVENAAKSVEKTLDDTFDKKKPGSDESLEQNLDQQKQADEKPEIAKQKKADKDESVVDGVKEQAVDMYKTGKAVVVSEDKGTSEVSKENNEEKAPARKELSTSVAKAESSDPKNTAKTGQAETKPANKWQLSSQKNKAEDHDSGSSIPVTWKKLPILFEYHNDWWNGDLGKMFRENSERKKYLIVNNKLPGYLSFTTRYGQLKFLTLGQYLADFKKSRHKLIVLKSGDGYSLRWHQKQCQWETQCSLIHKETIGGMNCIVLKPPSKSTPYYSWFDYWLKPADLLAKNLCKGNVRKLAMEKEKSRRNKDRADQKRYVEKRRKALLSGTAIVECAEDQSIIKNASMDTSYWRRPPSDGPGGKIEWFDWKASYIRRHGDYYISWDKRRMRGFAFCDVKKVSYGRITERGFARVVGWYSGNLRVKLISKETVLLPVLKDVYVDMLFY